MGNSRKIHPVARLLEALEKENIRFILIGMSAAIVQGIMEATLDVDLWIDLPSRQYMRVQNIARGLGAAVAAKTVAYLSDGTPMNFVFSVDGLESFKREYKGTRRLSFYGQKIPVLSLERILKSKEAIRREKDLAHITHIRSLLRCERKLKTLASKTRKPTKR